MVCSVAALAQPATMSREARRGEWPCDVDGDGHGRDAQAAATLVGGRFRRAIYGNVTVG